MLIVLMILFWSVITVEFINPNMGDVMFDSGHCNDSFNTVWNATLFYWQTLVAGDDWGTCINPLVQHMPWALLFFGFAFATVQLGFMNLILSAVVDSASAAREENHAERAVENQRIALRRMEKWKSLFVTIDANNDGCISLEELIDAFEGEEEVREYLQGLDIGQDDLSMIFRLMDANQSGNLCYDEFVNHFIKAQSQDSRIYLMTMKLQAAQIIRALQEQAEQLSAIQTSMYARSASEHSHSSLLEAKKVQQPRGLSDGRGECDPSSHGAGHVPLIRPSAVCLDALEGIEEKDVDGCTVNSDLCIHKTKYELQGGEELRNVVTDLTLIAKTSAEAIEALREQAEGFQLLMLQAAKDRTQLEEQNLQSVNTHAATQRLLQATHDMVKVAQRDRHAENSALFCAVDALHDLQRRAQGQPPCQEDTVKQSLIDRHRDPTENHADIGKSGPCMIKAQTAPSLPSAFSRSPAWPLTPSPPRVQCQPWQPLSQTTPAQPRSSGAQSSGRYLQGSGWNKHENKNGSVWAAKPLCISQVRTSWYETVAPPGSPQDGSLGCNSPQIHAQDDASHARTS